MNSNINKSGPWETEPDFIKWISHGLKCAMLRNHVGSWCGYVQLPPSHLRQRITHRPPQYNLIYKRLTRKTGYDHHEFKNIEVHGGLTFSGRIHNYRLRRGIWIGFDCTHYNDLAPKLIFDQSGVYRDQAYVHAEVEHLAEQIVQLI